MKLAIGLYAGYWDYVTSYKQARAINDYIGDNVKVFHVMPGGHGVFIFSKDTSWFTNITLPFIAKSNIICPPKDKN